jgi:hypothetical protein
VLLAGALLPPSRGNPAVMGARKVKRNVSASPTNSPVIVSLWKSIIETAVSASGFNPNKFILNVSYLPAEAIVSFSCSCGSGR